MAAFTLLGSELLPRSSNTKSFIVEVGRALDAHYTEEERSYLVPLLPNGAEVEARCSCSNSSGTTRTSWAR